VQRLLVCYVPAIDLRRVTPEQCPYIDDLLGGCPTVQLSSLPNCENVTTMVTGTYPHEHGMWGPKLRRENGRRGALERAIDLLPDMVTTTVQGVAHLVNGPIDLATMPPRRRRRFDWLRFNIKYLRDVDGDLRGLPAAANLLNLFGGDGRYVYHDEYWELDQLLTEIGNGDYVFEMVDSHSLDYLQHWNLDDEPQIGEYYKGIDEFLAALHAKCRRNGIALILLSDHGQEPVRQVIDLPDRLRSLDLSPSEYDLFIEYTRATFWFHTDRARGRILDLLASSDDGSVVPYQELASYGVTFANNDQGEAYFFADPGSTFWPNDFYQPLANVLLACKDKGMRSRLRRPWHRGDHGHLPEHPSETGFMALADDVFVAPDERFTLIDVAPSVLRLLGRPIPQAMKGRALFYKHQPKSVYS
jgi:hypothetical protein